MGREIDRKRLARNTGGDVDGGHIWTGSDDGELPERAIDDLRPSVPRIGEHLPVNADVGPTEPVVHEHMRLESPLGWEPRQAERADLPWALGGGAALGCLNRIEDPALLLVAL